MRLAASLLSLSFFFTLVASAQVLDQYKIGYGSDPYMTAINEAQPLHFSPGERFGQSVISLANWGPYGVGSLLAMSQHQIYRVQMTATRTVDHAARLEALEDTLTTLGVRWYWRTTRWQRLGDIDGDGLDELAVQAGAETVVVLYLNEDFQVKRHQQIVVTDLYEEGETPSWLSGALTIAPLGDFDGDGTPDVVLGYVDDEDGGYVAGAVWIVLMNPDGSFKDRQKISSAAGNLGVTLGDHGRFGSAMVSPGDLDGDGVLDVAVAAFTADEPRTIAGLVYVLLLNADGSVKQTRKIINTVVPQKDHFGHYLTHAGDLDGDGIDEVVAGTSWDGVLLFLNADGTVRNQKTLRQGDTAVSLGDINEDGVPDLAIGDPIKGGGDKPYGGTLALLSMQTDGTPEHTTLLGKMTPFNAGDAFGYSLHAPGDLNGDGTADLIVGAANTGRRFNSIWMLYLDSSGAVVGHKRIGVDDFHLSAGIEQQFGASVTYLGDLDGDGFPELAVGAPLGPSVWILFLNQYANVRKAYEIHLSGGLLDGLTCTGCPYYFGKSVATLGDLDGDGIPDLIAAASPASYGTATPETKASLFVLFLNADGSVRAFNRISPQDDHLMTLGDAMSVLHDLDGDGLPELAVGAQTNVAEYATYAFFFHADGTFRHHALIAEKGPVATTLGDVNLDGVEDMAIGMPFDGGQHARDYGTLWLYQMTVADTPGKGFRINKEDGGGFTGAIEVGDRFSQSLAYLGDLDGDGAPEVAVGVPYDDDSGEDWGAVWILSLDPAVLTHTATTTSLPTSPILSAAFPNPFRHQANLTLTLPEAQDVRVEAFDLLGRRVAMLHEGLLAAGTAHRFTLRGSAWPSGLYVVRATGETFQQQQTVLRVR